MAEIWVLPEQARGFYEPGFVHAGAAGEEFFPEPPELVDSCACLDDGESLSPAVGDGFEDLGEDVRG